MVKIIHIQKRFEEIPIKGKEVFFLDNDKSFMLCIKTDSDKIKYLCTKQEFEEKGPLAFPRLKQLEARNEYRAFPEERATIVCLLPALK